MSFLSQAMKMKSSIEQIVSQNNFDVAKYKSLLRDIFNGNFNDTELQFLKRTLNQSIQNNQNKNEFLNLVANNETLIDAYVITIGIEEYMSGFKTSLAKLSEEQKNELTDLETKYSENDNFSDNDKTKYDPEVQNTFELWKLFSEYQLSFQILNELLSFFKDEQQENFDRMVAESAIIEPFYNMLNIDNTSPETILSTYDNLTPEQRSVFHIRISMDSKAQHVLNTILSNRGKNNDATPNPHISETFPPSSDKDEDDIRHKMEEVSINPELSKKQYDKNFEDFNNKILKTEKEYSSKIQMDNSPNVMALLDEKLIPKKNKHEFDKLTKHQRTQSREDQFDYPHKPQYHQSKDYDRPEQDANQERLRKERMLIAKNDPLGGGKKQKTIKKQKSRRLNKNLKKKHFIKNKSKRQRISNKKYHLI